MSASRSSADGLRLALGTLTAVPIGPPASVAPPVPGRAMALAPLAGLVPGLAAAASAWLALRAGLTSYPAAVIALGMLALATRGLHLDGLADTADGLAASYRPDQALVVMRRGNTGPAGAAALVLVLLLQAAGLQQALAGSLQRTGAGPLEQLRAVALILATAVAARVAIPLACARGIPAARPEGLGATVAGSVPRGLLGASLLSAGAACCALARTAGLPWWAGLLAVGLAAAAAGLLIERAVRRFGGITGDVLGAAVELGTALALLGFAAAGSG